MAESKFNVEHHRRSVRLATSIAVQQTFPGKALKGGYGVEKAYVYHIDGHQVTEEDVAKLNAAVDKLVADKAPVTRKRVSYQEALTALEAQGQTVAAKLLKTRCTAEVDVHECAGSIRLRHFPLVENLGLLREGDAYVSIKTYPIAGGFVALWDKDWEDQPAIANSVLDHRSWSENQGVTSVADLNLVEELEDARKNFTLAAEFRQEQKLCEIAAMIHKRSVEESPVRVLCIAGPTSSGKTTFAHKLSLYLSNYGYSSKALTVDHYYHSVVDQPRYKIRQKREDIDYDHIESMDVKLVNEHVMALVKGETIMAPEYSFKTGNRVPPGHEFSIPGNGILVMEGIHALNPEYTAGIDPALVFRVYISPLTSLQLDDFNALKSTNHRLLRRMCRDYLFRGHSAARTISMWTKVRQGEHDNIFPHQNNSHYVMNSCMEYEQPVLKTKMEPLIARIAPDSPCWGKAQELMATLGNVASWDDRDVPLTSLMREFIGNGCWDKH